jgi:hypothetical protein
VGRFWAGCHQPNWFEFIFISKRFIIYKLRINLSGESVYANLLGGCE